jgi:hypothetical protein
MSPQAHDVSSTSSHAQAVQCARDTAVYVQAARRRVAPMAFQQRSLAAVVNAGGCLEGEVY